MILPIFPPSGYVPPGTSVWLNLQAMILPSFVLGTHSAGLLARFVRSSLLEVLGQDFIRTARAKGLTERAVVIRHAIKPAMIPGCYGHRAVMGRAARRRLFSSR